ncbi:MAG: YheC/YheD family protein [Bacillota bacterium]|nr:YheC/YheD family protein [Bacillota bacterium]
MDFQISVKKHRAEKPEMIINEKLAEKLVLTKKLRGFVSFGTQKKYVDISISDLVEETEIKLSSEVIEELHIPEYPIYEIRVRGNEIIIGPCIGIAASRKAESITKRMLKEIALHTLDYTNIHGAIIVFSLDMVNKEKRLIEGYCYNPQKDSWEKGVFPYPRAINRKTHMNEKWQNHFLSAIGDNIFNNYTFDKWDMYGWFSKEEDIRDHLPDTIVYNSEADIYEMLKKYPTVYVKPAWGMKGFGVVKVSREGSRQIFKYREDDENITLEAVSREEFDNITKKLFISGEHIVQQGLELFRFDGGIVDFRCVMQKNEACRWQCNGIIARVGAKDSVVSNISSGGAAMPAEDFIREELAQSEFEAFNIKERMVSLCMKVCRTLDEYGFNYATLGLDIGIDRQKNLWLIEVNNRRPHPGIALRANDIAGYYTILAGPMHYAKALAGFGSREEETDVL